jgi:hypothetical protein
MRQIAVLLLALGLGCSGVVGHVDDSYAVPLTEPWTAMTLPVADGAVKFSDPGSASIEYPKRAVAEVAKGYVDAVKATGWAETSASEAGGMFTATYAREGKTLTLSVISAGNATTVSLVQS